MRFRCARSLYPRLRHVVVAGVWHANVDWIGKAIPSITRNVPAARTILNVGDFGIWADG